MHVRARMGACTHLPVRGVNRRSAHVRTGAIVNICQRLCVRVSACVCALTLLHLLARASALTCAYIFTSFACICVCVCVLRVPALRVRYMRHIDERIVLTVKVGFINTQSIMHIHTHIHMQINKRIHSTSKCASTRTSKCASTSTSTSTP